MIVILIMIGCLALLCFLLMLRVNILEETNFELKDKLDLSDQEYIHLFKENMKIYKELSSLRVLEELKHL